MTYSNRLDMRPVEYPEGCRVLPVLLERAARLWPDGRAYEWFDRRSESWRRISWKEALGLVRRWQKAFSALGLRRGDRVAVLLTNGPEAILTDQALLANGLVPVPMHAIDTPAACAFVLQDSGARALMSASEARWHAIRDAAPEHGLDALETVVLVSDAPSEKDAPYHERVLSLEDFLAAGEAAGLRPENRPGPQDLAALVYTSGTTGRPKGVMLSHRAIIANLEQMSHVFPLTSKDTYFSYLPLSHAFERTVAYYYSIANGACLAIARSVGTLLEDMQHTRPTHMNTVPRVLEKIHTKFLNDASAGGEAALKTLAWAQEAGWRRFCRINDLPVEHTAREELDEAVWPQLDEKVAGRVRAIFGGRIRELICGGAALNYSVAKFFCAMDINLRQGYGLTESAPVISVSETPGNHPATVGRPMPGIEAKLGDNDELLVRGAQLMDGYWNRPEATRGAFTEDGFLKTGDQADLSDGGRIRIKGRIKEIIVTSTGEKIPPVDLEYAIQGDPLFEQVLVVGEGRPFISALVVVNPEQWGQFCRGLGLDPADPATLRHPKARRAAILRIRARTKHFPQYGVPRAVMLLSEHWTPENGLTTSTMKLRRQQITSRFLGEIERLYQNSPA
ncbi:long-chain fatty acid--CoA ligase [Mesosutterella sp. AGMB02718]|uniref:Long-chain fatty acid--CoA ligase n=1 Tax=Mesosutterella faecium TaxID=2925194 RepID=A0ABT7IMH6_9BURK|nr:long-chain fatty acid--CoA ligase [Mesosutterella sp. AGMB02718]MDL2059560.1 long-chain fatty acid--CoA ligase [Mesosutterella sp. AGMB02718]